LLAAAFPPAGEAHLAWIAFVPLLCLARFSPPRSAFAWGWLSGFLFWLCSLVWLLRLCGTGGSPPLVVLGWLALAAYCALYTGAFAMAAAGMWRRARGARIPADSPARVPAAADAGREPPQAQPPQTGLTVFAGIGSLLVLPFLWVGFEYLRSTLFTGLSWNALGVSQYRNLALVQSAEWGGVYAVSAVVMAMNAAVALTVFRFVDDFRTRRASRVHVELWIGLIVCAAALLKGAQTCRRLDAEEAAGRIAKITAVQPAIPQAQKWTTEFENEIYAGLEDLTLRAAAGRPNLVVWPETAVPYCVRLDTNTWQFVARLAAQGAPLLVGSMDVDAHAGRERYLNSSFLIAPDGRLAGVYRKRHLVPFGEYVPLGRLLPWLERFAPLGFSCAPGTTSTVFRVEGGADDEPRYALPFAALICFEDTIASLAREAVLNGARLLINQTNDAWFEGSSAAVQHLSHCVFRCVENRVPAVRCANLGVTCFIDRLGRIDKTTADLLRQGEAEGTQFLAGAVRVPADDMPPTFYTRHGDLPFALPCGAAAALSVVAVALGERRRRRQP